MNNHNMNSTHNAHAVLVDLFGELNMCKLSYAYNGQFTDELTKGLLTLSDQGMEQEQEARPTRRKVYFIMVESLQNITRHQGDADNRAADGFFVMNKFAKGYMVTSGNVVPNGDVEVLRGKLEKVNSLSGNELSDYYRKVLDEGQLSDKGGAGLGLIEMARKSGGKLVYQFKELSHRDSYFYFQCNVRGKDVEEHEQIFPQPALNTGLAERIHQTILDQRLELFYYGSFVHESLKGLLNMMEDGSKQQDTFLRKTLVSVMVELLQNICYHGAVLQEGSNEKPGLFMVARHEGYWIRKDLMSFF